ncbi:hypothetical protein T07_3518 [Trichinella nelsoni]|uniref:Uncharacterized protein n=1 Tax=Trichinella nelsoni TaxID=6336 RepID=A0A0V0S1I7_9BILA|nr:hypothetical protein T07_3518 [Trichinella nelsoni]
MGNHINSRENSYSPNGMKSRRSRSDLRENACKVLLYCYAHAYVVCDSMGVGLR